MALPNLFTQAQLENAVGGADRLVRLARTTGSTTAAYLAFVASVQAIADATGYANAQVYALVTDPTVQTAPMVSEMALVIGVYWAHFKGTGGMEIPVEVGHAYEKAMTFFRELKAGDTALGTAATPSTSAGLTQIDPNPTGTQISRTSLGLAGFA